MKFDQLIEYNKRNIFLKNHAENEAGRLIPDLFFFFLKKKLSMRTSGLGLVSIYFDSPQLGTQ